ncbi:MAG: prephenate dehydratase [Candidatus Omnitrophica bacterium]|nr:prephenate dehydratase [Candidatus Omnitrophota bacterium]
MLSIAYLGPENTNTHMAALAKFGKRMHYIHAPTVDDVFHLVERQKAHYGVVPVENSLEGAVTHTLDRFIDFKRSPVKIQGEVERPIQHYLIVRKGAKLATIKAVLSHPQALAQCRHWLDTHLRDAQCVETGSTSEAVQHILEDSSVWSEGGRIGPLERAAIGRAELADALGLRALPIPESRENKTRFLVLGLEEPKRGRRHKTSLLFALKDNPGALHDALVPFKRERINLTKIESRPSKRKAWEYLFFIDFEGHMSEPRVKRALKALERSTSLLRVLGSYPIAAR